MSKPELPTASSEGAELAYLLADLPTLIRNNLQNHSITTLPQLLALTRKDLLLVPHFGVGSLDVLEQALARRGLQLAHATIVARPAGRV